jgi:hypothetical protein
MLDVEATRILEIAQESTGNRVAVKPNRNRRFTRLSPIV